MVGDVGEVREAVGGAVEKSGDLTVVRVAEVVEDGRIGVTVPIALSAIGSIVYNTASYFKPSIGI